MPADPVIDFWTEDLARTPLGDWPANSIDVARHGVRYGTDIIVLCPAAKAWFRAHADRRRVRWWGDMIRVPNACYGEELIGAWRDERARQCRVAEQRRLEVLASRR